MPVHNGQPGWLDRAVKSVIGQSYRRWELCVVDDASSDPGTRQILEGMDDPRITLHRLDTNEGISNATNEGISRTRGEYIAFLDQDDELTKDALLEVVRMINARDPDLIYSDEGIRRHFPGTEYLDAHFKPDYTPDLLFSHNYVTHLLVLRRTCSTTPDGSGRSSTGHRTMT